MINTKLMPADFLTKNAPKEMHTRCRMLIGNIKPGEEDQVTTHLLPEPMKVSSKGGC